MKLYLSIIIAVSTVLMLGCSAPVNMSMLVAMNRDQQTFFQNKILPQFERQNRCRIQIVTIKDSQSVEQALAGAPADLGLVKIPFSDSRTMAQSKKLTALDTLLPYSGFKNLDQELLLTSLGKFEGKQFFIPRKFETRLIVYRKSKVNEALSSWRQLKSLIDNSLKKVNGFGLPANYILEDNPEQWDFYDIFVLGWFWGSREYNGKLSPRIGHPVIDDKGLALRQVDHVVQFGADSTAILHMRGESVCDMLHWEAVYSALGIYNPQMWKQNWGKSDLWEAFGKDEIFLSYLSQGDCFYIHGTAQDSIFGFLDDPEDMGVATLPRACSVELDSRGMPLREGTKSVMTGGWWWGVPASSPNPVLSIKLADYLSCNQVQMKECASFGMIPVRKDVLSFMPIMFGDGWVTQVYNTSFHQLMNNGQTVVAGDQETKSIFQLYREVWNEVVGGNWSQDKLFPNRGYISKLIEEKYRPRAEQIQLGESGKAL